MRSRILKAMGIGLALAACLLVRPAQVAAAPAAQAADPMAAPSRAMIDQYCVACHSERLKTGQLVLENRDLAKIGADAEIWEKVVRKLRNGQMPPMGARKPDAAARTGFLNALVGKLDQAAATNPNPGRHAIHRLNRVEYANAIRDLLNLDIDGKELLPADDSGHGFDNIAEAAARALHLLGPEGCQTRRGRSNDKASGHDLHDVLLPGAGRPCE